MCNSERAELCRRQLQELLENQPKTAQARERVREAMNAYIDHSPIDKLDVSLIEAAADWLAETDPDFPEFDLEGGLAKLLQSMPAQPAPARKHVRLRRIAVYDGRVLRGNGESRLSDRDLERTLEIVMVGRGERKGNVVSGNFSVFHFDVFYGSLCRAVDLKRPVFGTQLGAVHRFDAA